MSAQDEMMHAMDRFDEIRQKALPILKPYRVRRLAVFGSYARGDYGPESDIDLPVEFEDPPRKPLGLEFFGLQDTIGEALGRKVDLGTWRSVKRYMWPYIVDDLVMLHEKAV